MYTNPEGLAILQAQALDKLKEFEFGLRKDLGMDGQQQLFLAGSDEAPAGFRSAIEEYYKALAKK